MAIGLIATNRARIRNFLESFRRGPLGIISKDPIILYCAYLGARSLPFRYLWPVSWAFRSKSVHYLVCLTWSLPDQNIVKLRNRIRLFRLLFPNHKITILAGTLEEQAILKSASINNILCNHNCFVDENIFRPLGSPKKFDAIYDARIAEFKRHELLTEASNLALIYYLTKREKEEYCEYVKDLLKNSAWLNEEKTGVYQRLSPVEVNGYLNQSKVGLCLSAVEGQMYASIQYLLAGLPVVTTKNQGGRDEFFDPEYVTWVDDEPNAVNEGIHEMIEKNVSAEYVREATLEKIWAHRNRLFEFVQRMYDENGIERKFSSEWRKVFRNKILTWNWSLDEIKNQIESESGSVNSNGN